MKILKIDLSPLLVFYLIYPYISFKNPSPPPRKKCMCNKNVSVIYLQILLRKLTSRQYSSCVLLSKHISFFLSLELIVCFILSPHPLYNNSNDKETCSYTGTGCERERGTESQCFASSCASVVQLLPKPCLLFVQRLTGLLQLSLKGEDFF